MARKKAASKRTAKSDKNKTLTKKGPRKGSIRTVYNDALKLKVVKAIRKGMTHLEAAERFNVGRYSIPNWLKKFV